MRYVVLYWKCNTQMYAHTHVYNIEQNAIVAMNAFALEGWTTKIVEIEP